MRIATPRPLIAASPIPVLLFVALLVGCVMLAAAGLRWQNANPNVATQPSISLADAFGIGGLALMDHSGANPAASPAGRDAIVTYYGSPGTPSMGILGQHAPEDAADLLAQRSAQFAAASGDLPVLPAIHLVYAVAQPQPTNDGAYLQYLDDRTVRQYIELARRRGFVLILDLQIGHSDALTEVRRIAPYLQEPDVFVALDPEFALSGSTKPGDAIGSIDAGDINAVQWFLAALSDRYRIPAKMLVVHQFQAEMITHASAIERRTGVDLVIDMDGYGPADIKEAKYARFGAAPYAPYGGIKVFLQHDPDPLSAAELLRFNPRPSLFVYQ